MKTRLLCKLWWLGVHKDDVFLDERFHKDVGRGEERGGGSVHNVRTLLGAPRFFPWGYDTRLGLRLPQGLLSK